MLIHNAVLTGSLVLPTQLPITGSLSISGSVASDNYIATSTGNANVFNAPSATTGWLQVAMNNTNGSAILGIEGNTAGTVTNGSLAYATVLRNYTNTALQIATNNIVRMTISAAGTASFTGNALTSAADAATITLKQSSTVATNGIYLERSGEQKGYYIYVGGSVDSLNFRRNNAGTKDDVMSLTRDGYVGINNTAPIGLLNLTARDALGATDLQTAYNYSRFRIENQAGSAMGISMGYAGANITYIQTCYQNGTASPLVINPFGGNVGIGTNSPGYTLTVNGGTYGGTSVTLNNSFGATGGQAAQVVTQEFGGTSLSANLATLLPSFTFTSRALSVVMHVLGVSDSVNGTSVLINAYKASGGTWTISTVSTSQAGSTGVSSVTGSGNTITVNFNTTAFGVAYITVINRG